MRKEERSTGGLGLAGEWGKKGGSSDVLWMKIFGFYLYVCFFGRQNFLGEISSNCSSRTLPSTFLSLLFHLSPPRGDAFLPWIQHCCTLPGGSVQTFVCVCVRACLEKIGVNNQGKKLRQTSRLAFFPYFILFIVFSILFSNPLFLIASATKTPIVQKSISMVDI